MHDGTRLLGEPQAPPASFRWRDSLPFRLALAVNLAALGVFGAFWLIDVNRERRVHVRVETERLLEEAKVLRVARERLASPRQFQQFLDTFCQQMAAAASPGHHIAVFDGSGHVIARAHERADAALEAKMASPNELGRTFVHDNRDYLSAGVSSEDGTRIVVAQSLVQVEQIIRAQAVSRAVSLGILAVFVFGVTTFIVLKWVRDPLRELVNGIRDVGHGRFDVRLRPVGSAELRFLAEGVNEMTRALQKVEKHRQSQMLRARDIQRRLLPQRYLAVRGLEVFAVFEPTDSVGGDFYDVLEMSDGSILVVVLDVSGHGIASALYTALLRAILRHAARHTSDPAELAEIMSREFEAVSGDSGDFATCFLLRIIEGSRGIEYVCAGHDPAVIIRSDGRTEHLSDGDLPIGIGCGASYFTAAGVLDAGDRLYIYTDGLHEAFDDSGRQFGRERLDELLASTSELDPARQLGDILAAVQAQSQDGVLDDDVTLLCVRRKSPRSG
ncbi:MAG: SpoIIE family protein phosphatase [Planctomycetes bacterium]|nr:SpoIIE family protein phosphatase [Planctomycetota bacterium]